ncbi:SH3 domain-containing protein [Wenxinia saemankumensis]|uniref:SH3b domain-containing protein n=1 Tax=Wenxinia saemankumensis TaxID=1447782 RepID=A0A1M6HS68_9RHOB|nr:SH3 domain-containing protein [Wenxinia saemankumensis]SHJ25003.1 hypothetical protein SAMN05444417_3325 [Wenxinia saemankumensis]
MSLRAAALVALLLPAACAAVVGDRAVVTGVGAEDLLKLRAGPGLNYTVVLGLPDGTELRRGDCAVELGQLWCAVTLSDAPGIGGYVAADYLSTP